MNEQTLESLIKKYAKDYYTGEASVSDEYFDQLVENLRALNPDNAVLHSPGWGYTPEEKRKVLHWWNLQIGSLAKVKDGGTIPSRFGKDTRVSAKLDGLSVVSYYVGGQLIQSITRGNGTVGQDVTNKIKLIDSKIVNDIADAHGAPFTGAVRGEVVMPMSVWHSKYESQKKDNPSLNPRNIASGLLNRDDFTEEDAADLDYVVYKVLRNESGSMTLEEVTSMTAKNFTNTVDYSDWVDPSLLSTLYHKFSEKYPCDGLVFTNLSEGFKYDEVAFKFQAEDNTVAVNSVEWSSTRTGRVVPVIHFNPVELSGAIVQKCTGYNAMFIKENSIGKGAVIRVCRSNEVIPTVLEVVTPTEESELPSVCPKCGATLTWNGDDLICENENESQLAYNFITTVAPLDGAGQVIYSTIVESLDLNSVDDLVNLYKKVHESETGFVEVFEQINISGKATRQKVKEILKKMFGQIDPVDFLVACNIKGISRTTAKKIIEAYPEFLKDSSTSFNVTRLNEINDIGEKTIETLCDNKDRINRLYQSVIILEKKEPDNIEAKFKVAITGTLSMKRADFDKLLQEHGIEQSTSFKEIKYLITNNPDSTSSKMEKAIKNNVTIISEKEFSEKYLEK